MDVNLLRISMTIISFVVFVGIIAYAVYPGNRKRFEAASQLPFDDEPLDNAFSPADGEKPGMRG